MDDTNSDTLEDLGKPDMDDALKALSHPVRREILQWLREPEKHFSDQAHPLEMGICAGQFERCGLSQSTVSAHLASLNKAGLITSHKVGQWIFYKRDEAAIAAFLSRLSLEL
ncbi:ArsR/SmtB family transcription factor [Agrobacterium vitis]|uniref:ArsR/SmtB family transcription factor n=1 Tax=Agrobacterium vitis TaxID=373 RepID=UPI0008722206|nr:metalloregulator ArsR/SmtB family transcription factor [Agrobacterium vitis]MCM2450429.1 winged helix-turn-helix transcriptional regulator [Agrobacterium vitis]MCM2468720.1 winged helix-turn-helix transcriptional regulator [Agrobacterium vitis]BCH54927.1 transcriptional regulator [Agrobacterium vitis]